MTVALRLASVGGVWLLSFLVVLLNVAVAVLFVVRQARMPAVAGLVAAGVATSVVWVARRSQADGRTGGPPALPDGRCRSCGAAGRRCTRPGHRRWGSPRASAFERGGGRG
ncbi:hypothetical protein SHIRM173S_05375 [Streptomyces hirsutus]